MEIKLSFSTVLKLLKNADAFNIDGEFIKDGEFPKCDFDTDNYSIDVTTESGKSLTFIRDDNSESPLVGNIIFLTADTGDYVSCIIYEKVGDKYLYPKSITI